MGRGMSLSGMRFCSSHLAQGSISFLNMYEAPRMVF